MATKRNKEVNAERMRLERNARRKLQRLKAKGVNIGGLKPIRPVNVSDTRAVKKYNEELKKFNNRSTQYVAGYGGIAIPKSEWVAYQKVEREWNKLHQQYWNANISTPLISEPAMTLGEQSEIRGGKGTLYGAPSYQRKLPAEKVRSLKHLKRIQAKLEHELTDEYRDERMYAYRTNILSMATNYNDSRLIDAIMSLNDRQLERLHAEGIFDADLFDRFYKGRDDNLFEDAFIIESLLERIAGVKAAVR